MTDLQDPTERGGKYVGSELDLRPAWTVSQNLLLEGGWFIQKKAPQKKR